MGVITMNVKVNRWVFKDGKNTKEYHYLGEVVGYATESDEDGRNYPVAIVKAGNELVSVDITLIYVE